LTCSPGSGRGIVRVAQREEREREREREMGSVELPVADDADRARLQQLGYKQELKRGLSYVPPSILSQFPGDF
jgi:hypothetical protein